MDKIHYLIIISMIALIMVLGGGECGDKSENFGDTTECDSNANEADRCSISPDSNLDEPGEGCTPGKIKDARCYSQEDPDAFSFKKCNGEEWKGFSGKCSNPLPRCITASTDTKPNCIA